MEGGGGWNLSTLAGALLGDVLGDPRAYGLDAAAAAAFLALLWPRLRHRQPIAVGIAAAVVATLLTPVLMPGIPVLLAAVVAVVVREDQGLESATVETALAGQLAKFKQPKAVLFTDALPRNSMGKVQKAELRKTHTDLFA